MAGARALRHAILPLSLLCAVLLSLGRSFAWAQELGVNPSDFDAVLPYNQVSLPSDKFPMTLGTQTYRFIGFNLLPITANFSDSVRVALQTLYSIPNLTVSDVKMAPSVAVPSTQHPLAGHRSSRRLLQAPAPGPAMAGGFNFLFSQFMDSVDVTATCTCKNDSVFPPLGSVEAVYALEIEDAMAKMSWQTTVLSLRLVLAEDVLNITSRLNFPVVEAASFQLKMTGPSLVPFDLSKQNTVLTQLVTELTVTAGVHNMRIVQVDEYPPLSGTTDNVTITVIADHVTNKVADFGQALSSMLPVYGMVAGFQPQFTKDITAAGLPNTTSAVSNIIDDLPNATVYDQIQAWRATYDPTAKAARALGISSGAIAGVVVAAVIVGVACLVVAGLVYRRRRSGSRLQREKKLGAAALVSSDDPHTHTSVKHLLQSSGSPATSWSLDSQPSRRQAATALATCGSGVQSDWRLLGLLPDSSSDSSGAPSGKVLSLGSAEWDVDYADISICLDKDGRHIKLGQGGFGKVYKALRCGVQPVAVKVVHGADRRQLLAFTKEIAILKQLSFDKNILQYYGAFQIGSTPMLVLEYMAGGDLRAALNNEERGAEMCWNQRGCNVATDIARGMTFLHRHKVLHGDIKSQNVLLDASWSVAKLADVGLARVMDSATGHSQQHGCTFAYAAPEVLLNQRVTIAADIYSFGVLLWEICTSQVPIRGQLRALRVPEEAPAEIAALIDDCLQITSQQRPTIRQCFDSIQSATLGSGAPQEL